MATRGLPRWVSRWSSRFRRCAAGEARSRGCASSRESRCKRSRSSCALRMARTRGAPTAIVFTHKGISGPGVMDLSEPVAREEASARQGGRAARAHSLRLDLAPALERECLQALFARLAGRPALHCSRPRLRRSSRCRAGSSRGPLCRRAWLRARASTSLRARRVRSRRSREGPRDSRQRKPGIRSSGGHGRRSVASGGRSATSRVKGIERLWVFGEISICAVPSAGSTSRPRSRRPSSPRGTRHRQAASGDDTREATACAVGLIVGFGLLDDLRDAWSSAPSRRRLSSC